MVGWKKGLVVVVFFLRPSRGKARRKSSKGKKNVPSSFLRSTQTQYRLFSITGGIGLISVPSSCSIRYRLNLSS